MAKRKNLVFILISGLPLVFIFIFFTQLRDHANTEIFGGNGMVISKSSFIFLIIGLSVLAYFISDYVSLKLATANFGISRSASRSLINIACSVLSILLILSNR
jgi:hypothetical protein